MQVVLVERMHCDLGWRQREDQPAVTGVDRLVLQHVAEKRSVSLGVLAVDDDVSAVNHAPSIHAHEAPPNPPLRRPDQCFTEHARPVPVLAAYPLLIEFSNSHRGSPSIPTSGRWRLARETL